MKTKILVSSLLVTALLAGCSNEEYLGSNDDANKLKRPMIDFAFGVDNATTRMTGGSGIAFDGSDKVGAVLVDYDYNNPTSYYTIHEGHVGNNRFSWNGTSGKFETDGTMVKGAWLFYLQYDSKMTQSRNGVEFDLPVIQKYATDYSEIAKKDFRISPIINLEGQEDGHFDNFNLPMVSVYSYANIKMKFPEAVTVQKIVVKPTAVDLQTYAPFAKTYTVQNLEIPNAKLDQKGALETDQDIINEARAALQNNNVDGTIINYNKNTLDSDFKDVISKTTGTADQQLIALDCLDNETSSTDFQARMLIPAGVYHNISLYAYTDKGVYKYDVKNSYIEKVGNDTQEDFYLRRQHSVSLHKIDNGAVANGNAFLNMVVTRSNAELENVSETTGTVVIGQKDLVAVINGINSNNAVKIRVLGDEVVINPEVMAALTNKVQELSDVSLTFSDKVTVEGGDDETNRMTLHNVTFEGGCDVTEGYVEIGEDVQIPAGQMMTIAAANVTFAKDNVAGSDTYTGVTLGDGAVVKIAEDVTIGTITGNNGTLEIATGVKLTTTTTTNNGTDITVSGTWDSSTLTNTTTIGNEGTITVSTTGIINVKGVTGNTSTITNNGNINLAAVMTNSGSITNNAGAKIIAGNGGTGSLTNTGNIINSGSMYCLNGTDNTINNTGIIEAKEGSRTYITTNSSATEVKTDVNTQVTRGEVKCEKRDADMTVANAAQQGYISWIVPVTTTALTAADNDKFNKVYLNGGCDLSSYTGTTIKYVVVNANATVKLAADLVEFTANANVTLNVNKKSITHLTIADDKEVSVPTGNILGAYTYEVVGVIKEFAKIDNAGTLLVGGKFYSETITDYPDSGIFASGSGNNAEAYFWNTDNYGD